MVIPWDLVGTAAVAALLAAWWAGRRSVAAGHPRGAPVDLAVTLGLVALVGGRLVAVLVDTALSGVVPSWRSAVTLGAGLSTPGALAGTLLAGWWALRRGRVEPAVWRALVPAAAAGLALWSVLAVVRGEAGGVVAPFPLGWPLPGEALPRVPVAFLEAAAYGAFALVAARSRRLADRGPGRLAAMLAVVVAAVHLLGTLVRPATPTADQEIDVLLGVLVLVVAGLAARGVGARTARLATGVAAVAAAGLLAAGAFGGGAPAGPLDLPDRDDAPDLSDAVTAEGAPAAGPPAWGPEDLAGFVAAVDRPVVVNFWGSWCPPCHAEAPALARVARAYGDDVAFLGVLVNDEPAQAAAFAARYDLPFPSVDDGGLRGPMGATGVPTTVVLHPDGSVAARVVGGLDARGLAAAIDRAAR